MSESETPTETDRAVNERATPAADAQPTQTEPVPNVYVHPDLAGKLLFALDCAVRFTPQPHGGINMNEDIRPLTLQLGTIQQRENPA